MGWLENHWSLINYKTKAISYQDEVGEGHEIQGVQKPLQLRPITISQLAKCIKKSCEVYEIQVRYVDSKYKSISLGNIPVIQNFLDVFPEEIPGLPPKKRHRFYY